MYTVVIVGDFSSQNRLPDFDACKVAAAQSWDCALSLLTQEKADLLLVSLCGERAVPWDDLEDFFRQDAAGECRILLFVPAEGPEISLGPWFAESGRAELIRGSETLQARLRDWLDSRLQIQQLSNRIDNLLQEQKARESLLQKLVHDMKSPLTVMLIELGMLERWWEKQSEERFQNGIFRMTQNCEELIGMIQNMLDINRIRKDRLEIRLTTLGLASVLREVLENPPAILKKREIQTELDLRDTESPLSIDPSMINRALVNLLAASAKLCPSKGCILLSTRQRRGQMEILIECQGREISALDCQALFDQHAHERWRTLGLDAGSGIGLSFGRLLIEAHQGSLSVTCPSGRGATFAVTLPLANSLE